METGAILVVAAILIFVIGFIIQPLLDDDNKNQTKSNDNVSHLLAERDRLMDAILELDFDHDIGKVPENVFEEHRADLSSRTINVMKELEDAGISIDEASEKENKQSDRVALDDIEQMIEARRAAQSKTKGEKFCSECGTKNQKGDNFCTSCGNAL